METPNDEPGKENKKRTHAEAAPENQEQDAQPGPAKRLKTAAPHVWRCNTHGELKAGEFYPADTRYGRYRCKVCAKKTHQAWATKARPYHRCWKAFTDRAKRAFGDQWPSWTFRKEGKQILGEYLDRPETNWKGLRITWAKGTRVVTLDAVQVVRK